MIYRIAEKNMMNKEIKNILDNVEPQILSVAVINLDTLASNYKKIRNEMASKTIVAAVVKANAYGFGAVKVSKRLYEEGCRYFFVATINEGIEIRNILKDDAEIFVLSGVLDNTESLMIQEKLTPVLNNMYQVDLWVNFAKKIGQKLNAALHVDTGMARNGLPKEDIQTCKEKLKNNVELKFIMSHLACADTPAHDLNSVQLQRFHKETDEIFPNVNRSFSATNGIFLGKDYHFDIVRPGKSLYGFSIREDKVGSFEAVMDIFARIVQINELNPGDTIGYGATFTAKEKMRTITIGIGYADGFMRKFSGFGHGFLKNFKMPMVGRISMDYIVLDATKVPEEFLKMGAWVALTQSPNHTLERWALELGTIPHEISCRFGERVKKIYIGETDG